MREIWVETSAEIAVIEDGRLCEYLKNDENRSTEAVILGRVVRIVPGMQAAFVDIGEDKNGFLPLTEHSESFCGEKLQCGMAVPVQVKKEAQGTKGAFLTRDITLCGEYLLLMPRNNYIGVSTKLDDKETRTRLKRFGSELTDGKCGIVFRTSAGKASEDAVREEFSRLSGIWQAIEKAAPVAHVPSVLHRPRTMLDMLLDDYSPRGIDLIRTDDSVLAARLKGIFPVVMEEPGFLQKSKWPSERDKALERRIWLKSGGNLVIDRCEAMTVIDVNTAKFTGKHSLDDTALKTDLEACEEIAHQLRLRNLAGIILIDMIDLQTDAERKQVLDALGTACLSDRVKTVIHGFTSLGLVEMTRRKSRRALEEDWSICCPVCRGNGRVPKERETEDD